jgi:hypothetical protein
MLRPSPSQPLKRQSLIDLINASLQVKEFGYARQAALGWLAFFPGDLPVKLLYAQALYGQGAFAQALTHIEKITSTDPEYVEAQTWHRLILEKLCVPEPPTLATALQILGADQEARAHAVNMPGPLQRNYAWLHNQERPLAVWEVKALQDERYSSGGDRSQDKYPLAGVIQLRVMLAQGSDNGSILELAEEYHSKWPGCVPIMLILAHALATEQPDRSMQLLHESVALDTSAQVPTRMWGSNHPYLRLWPSNLEIMPGHATSPQEIPIPAKMAEYFGWNQLPLPQFTNEGDHRNSNDQHNPIEGGHLKDRGARYDPSSAISQGLDDPSQNTSFAAETLLVKIASQMKQPALSRIDGRYPVYIIFTSHQGLIRQYGKNSAEMILQELGQLADIIGRYRQWDGLLYVADEPTLGFRKRKLNILPTKPDDAWAMKLALTDLDSLLAESGEMVGAVLIVGGPEVVPFHHLPNPVDDSDVEVVSDNPYSTRDENYFIPEWPVGRLPGGNGKHPDQILKSIRRISSYHQELILEKPALPQLWKSIRQNLTHWRTAWRKYDHSYAYSAAIWRRASLSVFRPIGDPKRVMVCPPTQVHVECALKKPNKSCLSLPSGNLAYFNLHGLPDTDEWYGQRDPTEKQDGPDFPLALRAADISSNGNSGTKPPVVVFSEACYGASITGKSIHEAISLKLLSSGTRVVVGSTCISYGAIASPLIAADLLGHTFWHYLKEGQPAGEALRRAKIHLAREMHQRQGYLDGEDQKTLLSFILYGDPLVQITKLHRGPKGGIRSNKQPGHVNIVCDRKDFDTEGPSIPAETMVHVKQIVRDYLPGMVDAQVSITQERMACQGNMHSCPTAQMQPKTTRHMPFTNRQVVTLSKTIQEASIKHEQYARITLDASGKVVKLVISR